MRGGRQDQHWCVYENHGGEWGKCGRVEAGTSGVNIMYGRGDIIYGREDIIYGKEDIIYGREKRGESAVG